MTEPCVAPRKDGRPCGSVGIIFDPERNGMVCDAHVWPEIKVDVQKRMYGYALQAREALAEQRRAREALMLSLSDHGLNSVLKDLRNFRDGQPLQPKVRKILEGVLRENALRKPHPQEGSGP
jgi:hypothetical protein